MAAESPSKSALGQTVEVLRATLAERHGPAVLPVEPAARPALPAIPSGWRTVDARLPEGGLAAGDTVLVEGEAGAGCLALASCWAREAARRGEPVVVFDAGGRTHPQAWVPPGPDAAPIWRLAAPERTIWPAVDIAARSHAFGLLVLLEPPPAPVGAGPRLARHGREGGVRFLVTQWPGRAAPLAPRHRFALDAGRVRWLGSPLGAAPVDRRVAVTDGRHHTDHEVRKDLAPPGVPAPARAADRRAPSGRGGRRRRG